jgi:serine/threonine protein kinase/WD40 repeat protein
MPAMQSPTSGLQPLEPGDPLQMGMYRLLGRLGAGGMGQVFLGVSRGGRKVAVKVMRADLVADPEFRSRFAREVAIARTVNGFYTAPVVDADPDATPPWMVTAYVQGPSLAAAVTERGPLGEAEVRDLAAALAEGLASVHAGGLVHRDLKPANIILAGDGPRIIDFGIARAVGASTMTAQGTIIGTFTYMSPEQVKGLAANAQSDVFSLGSVLVFAATGHGPFEADSLPAITHRILTQPPDLAGLPESLRDVVTGCLVKDRAKRLTLDELFTRLAAADTASTVPAPAHPATVFAAGAPVSAPVPVLPSRPESFPAAPSLATEPRLPAEGTQTLGTPRPVSHPGYLSYPSNPPLPSVVLGTLGWNVTEIAFSADGRLLAGAAAHGAAWRVFLWDLATQQLTGAPVDGRGSAAPKMAFSPDGRLLVLKETGVTRMLSLVTRQFVSLRAPAAESSWKKVRFSPDGRLLATVSELRRISGFVGAQVRLWDCAALQPVAGPFKVDYVGEDTTLAFSPDSSYLFSGHDGQGFLGNVAGPAPELRKLKDLRGTSGRAAFSADGSLLAVQRAAASAVTVLDTAGQVPVAELALDRELTRIEFSPASPLLAAAMVSGGNEAIEFWHLTASPGAASWPAPFAGQHTVGRIRLTGFPLPVSDLRFSPDGLFLAAASRARAQDKQASVRLWAVGNAQPGGALNFPGPPRLAFSPDSQFLAVSCPDHAVRLVNLRAAGQVPVLPGSNAAFSPAAVLLATTEPAGVRLWNIPQ